MCKIKKIKCPIRDLLQRGDSKLPNASMAIFSTQERTAAGKPSGLTSCEILL